MSGRRLTVDEVYDLIYAETESRAQASRAASDYAASILKAGGTPE